MDKKLNIFILTVIATCVTLIFISKYLEIIDNKNMFEEYTKSIKSNIKQDYKLQLKENINTTITLLQNKNKNLISSLGPFIENNIQNRDRLLFININGKELLNKNIIFDESFDRNLSGIYIYKELFLETTITNRNTNKKTKVLIYSKLYKNWVISVAIPLDIINKNIKTRTNTISEMFQNQLKQSVLFELAITTLFILLLIFMNKKITSYIKKTNKLKEQLANSLKAKEYKIKKDLFKTIGKLKKSKLNRDITQKILHMGDWEYNIETKQLSSSKELYYIFEIQKEKVKNLRKEIFLRIHPDDRQNVMSYLNKDITQKRKNKLKFRLLFDDGRVKYLKELSELVFDDDGNHIKTVGTIYDITELTLLKNQTHKFFNFSANLLAIATKKGKVLQTNPSWLKILGYEKSELENTLIIDLIHSDDILKTLEEMKKIKDGQTIHYFENRCKHKDGTYRTIAWTVNIVEETNLIYATGQDITEVKENDLIMYQQSKMAAMGEMLGNIAHQWRQPLSIISTASSGLKIQHQMNLLSDKMLFELVDGITEATKYLSTTIDDFRNFFEPNKTKSLTNTSDIIEKTLNLISGQLNKYDIEIIKNISEIDFYIYENELMQVLINIFNNAKDQIIKERLHTGYIFIDIYNEENKLYIKIKDNAKGIEESIIDNIFEPYFTTKDKSIGTGIGLYMSQEIISKHMKGQLLAKNSEFEYCKKLYKGAEFSIVLDI